MADFVEGKIKYRRESDTIERFNHGIASGMLFHSEVNKCSSGLSPEFVKWIVVAMSVHSLKNAAKEKNLSVSLKDDPLTFLLCLCDELQVWNRSRPDETPVSAHFRSVELVGLSIEASTLTANIEYELFPLIDQARHNAAIDEIVKRLNREQTILKDFLKPEPLNVVIKSTLREPRQELPEIRL